MSYCVNPACPQPENLDDAIKCKACGSKLLLRNRYRVVQPLGKGGFGATFLAADMSLPGNPNCVVKQLRPTATSARILEMARELFQREAKTLGKIGDHPQIPRLIDYFVGGKQFYLVQEYVDGYTLKQEVKGQGIFDEAQAKKFLREILPILDYIHSQEVIHRDIKPANILRRRIDQNLVLIDFGAVKDQVNQATMMGTGQTAFTNFAIGTSGFAPPEQMALRPVYASDIYAVGMTCVYLMTGKSPNSFESNQVTGEILWQPHLDVSDSFGSILQRMLEFSVQYRYQSAQDVLRALDSEFTYSGLSDGMVMQHKSNSNSNTNNTKLPTSTDEATVFNENTGLMLPSERIGAQIRERKQRLGQKKSGKLGADQDIYDQTSLISGFSSTQGAPVSMISDSRNNRPSNSTSVPVNSVPKWNENTLKTAYTKGRRDFADCELTGLNLENFDASGANFYESRLSNTNFQGADLTEANFGRARLTNVNLRNAKLVKAYMSNANLEKADLRGANLRNACLNRANLRGVNLCGANLTDAIVTDEQLAMAKLNGRTIRPNGKRKGWWWWWF